MSLIVIETSSKINKIHQNRKRKNCEQLSKENIQKTNENEE